jgi:hypothetical protein
VTIPEPDPVRRMTRAENDIIAVYELLGGIQRTVDQQNITLAHHSTLLHSHSVRLDRIEIRLDRVDTRLDRVETRLDEHGGMLKEILRRLPAAS